jgi:hypothetical protein
MFPIPAFVLLWRSHQTQMSKSVRIMSRIRNALWLVRATVDKLTYSTATRRALSTGEESAAATSARAPWCAWQACGPRSEVATELTPAPCARCQQGKDKKTRKFAQVKRMISPKDMRMCVARASRWPSLRRRC